jgi:hypothetical protein
MFEFEGTTRPSDVRVTTATAHLPGLDIEIVHRRHLTDSDKEEFSIYLQSAPYFEAFRRFVEAANPFVFWAEATRRTWYSWLEATGAAMLSNAAPPVSKNGSASILPFPKRK